MTRKTLAFALFALFALLAITAHAQRFDWVRTYTGPEFPVLGDVLSEGCCVGFAIRHKLL